MGRSMSANSEIADDWTWFPEYQGILAADAELIAMQGGKAYRVTQANLRRSIGLGWAFYADSVHTSSNKQSISAGVRTQITIDKLGDLTETRFRDGLPDGVWAGNKIVPQSIGESYMVRLQFRASEDTSSSGQYLTIELDIGSVIWSDTVALAKGQGVEQYISLAIPIFCLETFYANGGAFYVTPSDDVQIWNKFVMLQRISQP